MKSDKPLTFASILATCYPLGFMPKAPGTWGSIPGVFLGIGFYHLSQYLVGVVSPLASVSILLVLFSLFSFEIIRRTESQWGTHDDKSIVIDEVAGQAIPLAFFAPSLKVAVVSFLLFRLFDITKPLFIGWADKKLHGALGTLLDDVFAGLVVLVLLVVDSQTLNWIV